MVKNKLIAAVLLSLAVGAVITGCGPSKEQGVSQVSYEKTENVVRVFFWYGCPHCYAVHKEIRSEQFKNIKFEYIAVPGNKVWTYHAANFYTLKRMGLLEVLNEKFFDFIQDSGSNPSEEEILKFIAQQGVDPVEYKRVLDSVEVKHDLDAAKELSKKYGVSGVPAVFMDGTVQIKIAELNSYSEIKERIHSFYKR
jgi:thiol:disulfide interchange protein DsbA